MTWGISLVRAAFPSRPVSVSVLRMAAKNGDALRRGSCNNARSRSSPELKRNGQWIDVDPDPPGGFVAIAVQFAVVETTEWNRVLIADLAAERTRLSEANVVRFARRPAAHNAGLGREISTMLLVAKPNRSWRRRDDGDQPGSPAE